MNVNNEPEKYNDTRSTITFNCIKCTTINKLKINQQEILFGGADPTSAGNRSIQSLQRARVFITRCNACKHANRISIEEEEL